MGMHVMFPKFLHAAARNAGHGGISVYYSKEKMISLFCLCRISRILSTFVDNKTINIDK